MRERKRQRDVCVCGGGSAWVRQVAASQAVEVVARPLLQDIRPLVYVPLRWRPLDHTARVHCVPLQHRFHTACVYVRTAGTATLDKGLVKKGLLCEVCGLGVTFMVGFVTGESPVAHTQPDA